MTRLDSYSWRASNNPARTISRAYMPICKACHGATIGEFGEQCLTCSGNGFIDPRRPDQAAASRRYNMRVRR